MKFQYQSKWIQRFRALAALGLGVVMVSVGYFASAVTYIGPIEPPGTHVGAPYADLGDIRSVDEGNLISKTEFPYTADIQNRLTISTDSGGTFPAYFSYAEPSTGTPFQAGLIGVGTDQPYTLPWWDQNHVAIFGFGPNTGYGIYAEAKSTAVLGLSGFDGELAARFTGRSTISDIAASESSGGLFVEDSITSARQIVVDKGAQLSVGTENTRTLSGTASNTDGVGVQAYASDAPGIRARSVNASIGAYGLTTDGIAGVYGFHWTSATRGDGIIGEAAYESASVRNGIRGESMHYGVAGYSTSTFPTANRVGGGSVTGDPSGVGIYACGRTEAGIFDNDVHINGSLHMGGTQVLVENGSNEVIGSVYDSDIYLSATDLDDLIAACAADPVNCD